MSSWFLEGSVSENFLKKQKNIFLLLFIFVVIKELRKCNIEADRMTWSGLKPVQSG